VAKKTKKQRLNEELKELREKRRVLEDLRQKKPQAPAIISISRSIHRTHHLYWAYGSNLNVAEMQRRCPQAVKYQKLYVNNGLLVFRDRADVMSTKSSDDFVAGGLWWITDACEKTLDRYEGAPRHYAKRYLTLRISGVVRTCLFYKMNDRGIMPPDEAYLDRIAKGYHDFDLDLTLLSMAVARSHEDKQRTPYLRESWERRGKLARAKIILG